MQVSYKKLWMLLVEKDMSKADLRRAAELSPSVLTKMNKGECVHLTSLLKICEVLDCDFADIVSKNDII